MRLEDSTTHAPLGGIIRVTPIADTATPLVLAGVFERPAGWFSMQASAELKVPPGRYKVEAVHGTDTLVAVQTVVCAMGTASEIVLPLVRFYDASARHLHDGNTHLHLLQREPRKLGVDLHDRRDADAYLETVGGSDGLDLVYVSYLTTPEREIMSNEYTDADFEALSHGTTRFVNGVELRHGGARIKVATAAAEGKPGEPQRYAHDDSTPGITYGHVLLLDLVKRSMQASVGPGLADDPNSTDGIPLRHGIEDARGQGSGIVWCHGTIGLEQVPDWVAGLIDAQNIYDGGNQGTFDTVYYPYLNAGLKVPFSTGTDWGITDFSRVYVSSSDEFSSKVFLRELTEGRSYITNEPFLEFDVNGRSSGDTISLERPGRVTIRGRAIGRSDFVRLQLVRNGNVVEEVSSHEFAGHYEAAIDFELPVEDSGWIALRIPPVQPYEYRSAYTGPGTNVFGKAIFAHTSPVYLTVAGRPVFDRTAVGLLLARVDDAMVQVQEHGVFANEKERADITRIYLEAKRSLEELLIKGEHD